MSVVMAMEGVNLSFKIGSGPRAVHKQVLSNLFLRYGVVKHLASWALRAQVKQLRLSF